MSRSGADLDLVDHLAHADRVPRRLDRAQAMLRLLHIAGQHHAPLLHLQMHLLQHRRVIEGEAAIDGDPHAVVVQPLIQPALLRRQVGGIGGGANGGADRRAAGQHHKLAPDQDQGRRPTSLELPVRDTRRRPPRLACRPICLKPNPLAMPPGNAAAGARKSAGITVMASSRRVSVPAIGAPGRESLRRPRDARLLLGRDRQQRRRIRPAGISDRARRFTSIAASTDPRRARMSTSPAGQRQFTARMR